MWVQKGAPPQKLNIGLPLYGRSFTLKDQNKHRMGDPVKGGGKEGKMTSERGYMSYYEVRRSTMNE